MVEVAHGKGKREVGGGGGDEFIGVRKRANLLMESGHTITGSTGLGAPLLCVFTFGNCVFVPAPIFCYILFSDSLKCSRQSFLLFINEQKCKKLVVLIDIPIYPFLHD
jgi:hypothetical protein